MTLDEMMDRRDLAAHTYWQLKGKLYGDKTGVYNMEDFEKRTFDELEQYATQQFKIGPYNSLVFSGWVTTKGLAHKYVDFLNAENFKYPVLMLLDLRTFIIFDSPDTYIEGLKKLGAEIIMNSSLNLTGIFFADNGFEVRYNDHTKTILFEEKPKTIEDILADYDKQEDNVDS